MPSFSGNFFSKKMIVQTFFNLRRWEILKPQESEVSSRCKTVLEEEMTIHLKNYPT